MYHILHVLDCVLPLNSEMQVRQALSESNDKLSGGGLIDVAAARRLAHYFRGLYRAPFPFCFLAEERHILVRS